MPFPDSVRLEALKKAYFQCVACHAPFVEVHHIIPESENGPNTLENAAPLCAGCHGVYGGNPTFRKQISQMRDNWFDVCERRFGPSDPLLSQKLNELGETLQTMRADQRSQYQNVLSEIKKTMGAALSSTAAAINRAGTLEEVVTASGYQTTGVHLGPQVYANVQCRKCGSKIDLLVGSDTCPNCGTSIYS